MCAYVRDRIKGATLVAADSLAKVDFSGRMNAAIAFILTASVAAVYTPVPGAAQSPVYTNAWGVKVVGGLGVANSVAMRQGLTNMGQVSPAHTHSVLL